MKGKAKYECPKCGLSKFKTVSKAKKQYACRRCGTMVQA